MRRVNLLSLWVGMMLVACSLQHKPYPAVMQQAADCLADYPDSALTLLGTLPDKIKGEPEDIRMYYHLLTVKAKDKCYIRHTSDSLINAVVAYYEKEGDNDRLMEAYYYQGSVYRDMGDVPRAIKAFQQAIDAGEGSHNLTLLGQTYGQMGTLFAYQDLYDESLDAKRKALHYYTLQKDSGRSVYALRDIARMFDAKEDMDSAICYYGKAHELAERIHHDRQADDILSELGCLYNAFGKVDVAKQILLSLTVKRTNALLALGLLYQETNQPDSMEYFLKEVMLSGNIYQKQSAYKALSRLEESKGNYQNAFAHALRAQEYSDSIALVTQTEAVKKIQSLYDYRHTEQENIHLLHKNQDYFQKLVILVLLFILFIFIALYLMHRIKQNKQAAIEQERRLRLLKEYQYEQSLSRMEENNEKQKALQMLLEKAEKENDTLNRRLILSQKKMLELENRQQRVSRTNRELLEQALKESDIYVRFHQAGGEGQARITEDDWEELRVSIDTTYFRFTEKLYSLYPDLSQRELRICYLIKISMPNNAMARVLVLSPSAVTQARKRLYKKIYGEEGNGESLDKIIIDL